MITQDQKDQIIEWINELDDPSTLDTIYALKQSQESPVKWDHLSNSVKSSIEKGLKESKTGQTVTDKKIWESFRNRI
jgi:hypothetical protein